jgi:hypothetical protein
MDMTHASLETTVHLAGLVLTDEEVAGLRPLSIGGRVADAIAASRSV